MSRSRRSGWTLLTGTANTGLAMVVGLYSTPLLLRLLGDERFGAIRLSQDWGGYIGLLEFGVGGAMLPLVARAASGGNHADIRSAVSAAQRAFIKITGLMFVASILYVVFVRHLIPVTPPLQNELLIASCLGMLGLVTMLCSPLRPILEASQRGYLVNVALSAQNLSIIGLSLLLAYLTQRYAPSWGLPSQTMAALVGNAIFFGVLFYQCRRLYPSIIPSALVRPGPPTVADSELRGQTWPMFVSNVSGRVSLMTDNIVTGLFLGAKAVSPFLLTERLLLIVQGQLQNIGTATWAAQAELYALGELDLFRKRLMELTRLVLVSAFMTLGPLAVFNHSFISLWVGPERYAGDLLTGLVVFNCTVQSIISLWGWMISGTGKASVWVPHNVTSATVNLLASLAATWLLSHSTNKAIYLAGPAVGTTIAFITVSFWWMPLLMRQHFGVSFRMILSAFAGPLAIGFSYLALLILLRDWLPTPNWILLGTYLACSGGGFLLLSWMLLLTSEERLLWQARFRQIARRK